MIRRGGGGDAPPPVVPTIGVGRVRKIAIVGSAETVKYAPWYDPTWEIWSHAVTSGLNKRTDRMFEMHPAHIWREHVKPQWPGYLKWLQHCPHPVYMLEKHKDIRASVRYPRERIFGEHRASLGGRLVFTSQTDFMIALALSEGVSQIGLFGVQYTASVNESERNEQLLGLHYWAGVANGKGVAVVVPEGHTSFVHPIYGLETHATKALYAARLRAEEKVTTKQGVAQLRTTPPKDPVPLKVALPDDMEDRETARRRWEALVPA